MAAFTTTAPLRRISASILVLSLLATASAGKVLYSLTRFEQTGNAICLKASDDNAAAATQTGAFDLNYADVMFAGVNPGSSTADVVVLSAVNKASKPLEVLGAPTVVLLDSADSPKRPTTETVSAPAVAYTLQYATFDIALRYVLPKYLTPSYASNGQLSLAPKAVQPGPTGAAAILFTSERDPVYMGGVTWTTTYLVHRPDPSPTSVGFQFVLFEASFYQPPPSSNSSSSSSSTSSSSASAAAATPSPMARRLLLAQAAAALDCNGSTCPGRSDSARSGAAAFVCRPRYPCPLGCTPGKSSYPNCCLACSAS
ncbi:hypothetical protein CLOM_g10987 [Closterium sp. NIES-68]|nr:hypothetical protein CLOM_g10987 [Closterium sp. NIES-68]GJP71162.1 hypothetical protein CLOP_g2008 [Closterium sp. NIES-67]